MFDLDAAPTALLTAANPKTAKNATHGYLTEVLHLAPARLSGRNVCQHATSGCIAACLNTAGHGGLGLGSDHLNVVQAARIRRTRFLRFDRTGFFAMLERELHALIRRAERDGLRVAVRLNGTSDVPWERLPITVDGRRHGNVMRAFPGVTFYDYTKSPLSLRGERRGGGLPPNYSLTFSLSERNERHALAALERDVSVAVVFHSPAGDLPTRFMDRQVIDGDEHDLRFLDPPGVIVGLRAKGRAKRDRSGFVQGFITDIPTQVKGQDHGV